MAATATDRSRIAAERFVHPRPPGIIPVPISCMYSAGMRATRVYGGFVRHAPYWSDERAPEIVLRQAGPMTGKPTQRPGLCL
jgi:hypothetical protein